MVHTKKSRCLTHSWKGRKKILLPQPDSFFSAATAVRPKGVAAFPRPPPVRRWLSRRVHPAGTDPPHFRQWFPCGIRKSAGQLRSGQHSRNHCQRAAGFLRNHLLHHCPVLRHLRHPQRQTHPAVRPVRRLHCLSVQLPVHPLVRIKAALHKHATPLLSTIFSASALPPGSDALRSAGSSH